LVLEKIIAAIIRSFFIISCAAFHAAWILLALNYLLEMEVETFRVVGGICFAVVLFYCFKLGYKKLERL
jgi:predicted tellurium resistance membrane protein TerC